MKRWDEYTVFLCVYISQVYSMHCNGALVHVIGGQSWDIRS